MQVDTVRELITEHIFTSDTVYINETITLAGDADTLVINRTLTIRDMVYSFTKHTEYITRVDSLYLLGGDYLADLNSVTSVDQLEVEKLGNPYPNPVSIDYVTAVPTSDMFLRVYDNQGRRVEQFPVKPSHTVTFDVSDWAPGMYAWRMKPYYTTFQDKRLRALQSDNPKTIAAFYAEVLLWFDEKYYNELRARLKIFARS